MIGSSLGCPHCKTMPTIIGFWGQFENLPTSCLSYWKWKLSGDGLKANGCLNGPFYFRIFTYKLSLELMSLRLHNKIMFGITNFEFYTSARTSIYHLTLNSWHQTIGERVNREQWRKGEYLDKYLSSSSEVNNLGIIWAPKPVVIYLIKCLIEQWTSSYCSMKMSKT